jgi:hypothetical protein
MDEKKSILSVEVSREVIFLSDAIYLHAPRSSIPAPITGGLAGTALNVIKEDIYIATEGSRERSKSDIATALNLRTRKILSMALPEELKNSLRKNTQMKIVEKSDSGASVSIIMVIKKYGYRSLGIYSGYKFKPELSIIAYMVKNPPFEYTINRTAEDPITITDPEEHQVVWKASLQLKGKRNSVEGTEDILAFYNNPALMEECLYQASSVIAEDIASVLK